LTAFHTLIFFPSPTGVAGTQDFDAFCEQMTPSRWVNPHRSPIPYIGNYDLNVITSALAQASPPHTLRWHDARHSVSSLPLNLPPPPDAGGQLVGLLVHTRHAGASRLWGLLGSSPHWLVIRLLHLRGAWQWVMLDSLAPPRLLDGGCGAGSAREYVADVLTRRGHVLLVHRVGQGGGTSGGGEAT